MSKNKDFFKTKIRNRYLAVIVINIIVFVLIGLVYYHFYLSNNEKIFQENLKNIRSLNGAIANAADTYTNSMTNKMEDMIFFAQQQSIKKVPTLLETVQKSNTNTGRQIQLILCEKNESSGYNGWSVKVVKNQDGTLSPVVKEIVYPSEYTELIRSFNDLNDTAFEGTCFAPEFTDADTKLKSFAIYKHLILQDEQGQEKPYMVMLVINSQEAQESFVKQHEFAGQSSVLINASGDYILKNDNFKGLNFFEYLRNYNNLSLDQRNEIRQSVNSGEINQNLFYKDSKNQDCVFSITRMPNNWYSITSVPISSFTSVKDSTNYSLIILVLFISLFIVDGIVIFNIGKAMRKNVLLAEKATLEANKANLAKSQFLSTMSHELRTPLNAIIGLVSLSTDSMENPTTLKDYLRKMEFSSKLLLQLISDILDVSAIESNKMKISSNEFDITKLISTLSSIFYDQCATKGIDFKAIVKNVHSEEILGDSRRVNQILLNFLSNAVKFTPPGGQITLKVEQFEQENGFVTIRFDVIDTGCGISDEMKTRLFQPFEQESAETSKRFGGTGLGLSIAKKLTELMGGNIEVESTVGQGSRFSCIIPFKTTGAKKFKTPSSVGKKRMLAAIEDAETREYIDQLLTRFGVEHTMTDSAEKAINLLRQGKSYGKAFDLFIYDAELNGNNPAKVAKTIRLNFDPQELSILVMSYNLSTSVPQCLEAGVNTVIPKPIFPSDFYNVLEEITSGHVKYVSAKKEKFDFSGKRVLLVEDNLINVEIASLLLQKTGLLVDKAENGQKGFAMFEQSPEGFYDAILMDIQMPVMNGYEATKLIRSCDHPQAQTVQIIAMTADAFSEDVERAENVGMNAHLAKPIEPELMYTVLQQAFNPE